MRHFIVTLLPTSRRGQATIEYVLMLVSVVVIFSAFISIFNTDIVHYIFSFIGQLLPEGT